MKSTNRVITHYHTVYRKDPKFFELTGLYKQSDHHQPVTGLIGAYTVAMPYAHLCGHYSMVEQDNRGNK